MGRDEAAVAELTYHLTDHGCMFMDGERKVQCLCGWSCSYDEATERGFEDWGHGRMDKKKKSVLDAFARLSL